jgi:hypothetical protein
VVLEDEDDEDEDEEERSNTILFGRFAENLKLERHF